MPEAPSRTRAALKRSWPYLIAGIALGWVLWRTDMNQLWEALQRAPMLWFAAVSTVLLIINWMLDTFAMTSVFAWFGHKVRYRELLIVRGSTYLLAILNYHVGQAAIVGYLYRVCKVPFLRATGWILFIIGINVGTLFLLASAGAASAPDHLKFLRSVPPVTAIGVVVYALLLWSKPRILAERRLFAPLFEMGIWGHIKGVAVRLPHIGNLIVWQYITLHLFGIDISALDAFLYLPAYFAVAALPINVNGLGVAQAVAVAFFAPHAVVQAGVANPRAAQEATVLAWSLAMQGFSIVHQLALGFLCLRPATALGVQRDAEAAAAAEAQPAPSVAPRRSESAVQQ